MKQNNNYNKNKLVFMYHTTVYIVLLCLYSSYFVKVACIGRKYFYFKKKLNDTSKFNFFLNLLIIKKNIYIITR